jgi:hypothetical protein
MMYRTKTYIAADWTDDKEAVDILYKWKENSRLTLDFVDAHSVKQARDSSLNCSIKKSLRERLNITKTFVLIVGKNTKTLQSGSCRYCSSYNSYTSSCGKYMAIDYRSYIDYECEMAVKDYLNGDIKKIVVLYNYANVDKSKCPDSIKNHGTHINMYYYSSTDQKYYWDYSKIKEALS